MVKLLSLFSGIGAFEKALKRLNIDYELVGFSEIDKFAVQSYCKIHNVDEKLNLGDIKNINENTLPDFDLMTWGFPCQDISIAGKLQGIKKDETRSGLYYDGYRIFKKKKPAISIIENVKNLTSKRFKKEFESILSDIEKLGYNNYWKVLNAKDFGIPQNRERVFIVSIRKDVDKNTFTFPQKVNLLWKLKDFLENIVDEKYYLSEKAIGRLVRRNNKLIREMENPKISACIISNYYKLGARDQQYIIDNKINRIAGIYDDEKSKHQAGSIYNPYGISPSLTDMSKGGLKQPMILINEGTKKGYIEATIGDSINISYPQNTNKRGRVGKEISNTITTSPNMGTMELLENNIKIRRLTPLECWRLMGFDDFDYYKAKSIGISDTQLYRQARKQYCCKCT